MTEETSEDKFERIMREIHEVNISLKGLQASLRSLERMADDHEIRLRTIERWQNNLTPVLAAITFMLGISFTQVVQRLF